MLCQLVRTAASAIAMVDREYGLYHVILAVTMVRHWAQSSHCRIGKACPFEQESVAGLATARRMTGRPRPPNPKSTA